MAYSISGKIFDQNDIVIPNCYYQFFFLKVNNSSGLSVWSNVYQTDEFGYYSHDIQDGDMLGALGIFHEQDEIIIAYWLGDSNRNNTITLHANWIHIIENRNQEFIIQDLKIYNHQPPIAYFTGLPSDGIVDTTYTIENLSTADFSINEEGFYNTTFYQHFQYKNETIFNINDIKSSTWDYNDSTIEHFSGKMDGSKSWSDVGIYNVTLTIEKYNGLTSNYTQQIIIRFAIYINFDFSPFPGILNKPIDFTNTTLDQRNRVIKYIWEMYDGDILSPPNDEYEGDYILSPKYIFINSPDRCVILKAYWNDGFVDQISEITKCIPFNPLADFEKIETNCAPIYRDRSVAGLSPKIFYWWIVYKKIQENLWKELFRLEGNEALEIQFQFPDAGNYKIWHKIEDSNNLTNEIEKIYNIESCPCGQSIVTGGGGYKQVKKSEFPIIKVKFKDMNEKRKIKLKLKLIITEQINNNPIITILD